MAANPNPAFQRALTQPVDPSNMAGSLAGTNIGPPNVNPNAAAPAPGSAPGQTPGGGGTAPFDAEIKAAYDKLNGILSSFPEIDYEQRFKGLINDIANRPTGPGMPNPFAAAAFAMGSPGAAPQIMENTILHKQALEDQKQNDMLKMKEQILQGSISQEIQKGNFKVALKQSEALSDLQRAMADRERALNMQDWQTKQSIKTTDAKSLLQQRIQGMVREYKARGLSLSDKEQLAILNHGLALYSKVAGAPGLIPGTFGYDQETGSLLDRIWPDMENYVSYLKGVSSGKTPAGTPEAAKTPPPAPKSPYAQALENQRKAATTKK